MTAHPFHQALDWLIKEAEAVIKRLDEGKADLFSVTTSDGKCYHIACVESRQTNVLIENLNSLTGRKARTKMV